VAPADPAALGRALAGVDRAPVPPEGSYLAEIGRVIQEAILEALMRGARVLHLSKWTFFVLALGVAILALVLIVRALWPRLRRRSPAPERGALAAVPAPAAALDAAGWRAELDRRLAAGRIPQALEALWWWLARSLAGAAVEPDWTTRDLVARSRRDDLREFVRRLDAFLYGPLPPSAEDLRGLLRGLEERLA
jgi:Domain of unknown function (DUF4129)